MNKTQVIVGVLIGALIGAGGYWWWSTRLPGGATAHTIEDPTAYWDVGGFFRLEPPVHLPITADRNGHIEVWLKIPAGGTIETRERAGTTPTVRFPAGTISDRVEYRRVDGEGGEGEQWQVADVRGTELLEGRAERFRLYRPVGPGAGQPLFGFQWPRGAADAQEAVLSRFGDAFMDGAGWVKKPRRKVRKKLTQSFKIKGQCTRCHIYEKPETLSTARRATDASGFYTPQSVLFNDAPLEAHRARDINHEAPFMDIACPDGSTPKKVEDKGVHFDCGDQVAPRATLRLVEALAAGDAHAKAVCQSRAHLLKHLDDTGRKVFRERFTECGLSP